jgi:hypothetical protein
MAILPGAREKRKARAAGGEKYTPAAGSQGNLRNFANILVDLARFAIRCPVPWTLRCCGAFLPGCLAVPAK